MSEQTPQPTFDAIVPSLQELLTMCQEAVKTTTAGAKGHACIPVILRNLQEAFADLDGLHSGLAKIVLGIKKASANIDAAAKFEAKRQVIQSELDQSERLRISQAARAKEISDLEKEASSYEALLSFKDF